jgi:hypothetical protein
MLLGLLLFLTSLNPSIQLKVDPRVGPVPSTVKIQILVRNSPLHSAVVVTIYADHYQAISMLPLEEDGQTVLPDRFHVLRQPGFYTVLVQVITNFQHDEDEIQVIAQTSSTVMLD